MRAIFTIASSRVQDGLVSRRALAGQTVRCTEQAIPCIVSLSDSAVEYHSRNEVSQMDVSPVRSKSPRWLWIASIWFAVGLFMRRRPSSSCGRKDAPRLVPVVRNAARFLAAVILATPLVMRLGRRYPPVQLSPFSTWVRHLAACASIGLVAAAWIASLEELLNPWAKDPVPDRFAYLWLHKFYNGLLEYLFLYGAILLVSHILIPGAVGLQQTESARLNEATLEAQLNALRHKSSHTFFLIRSMPLLGWCAREETMPPSGQIRS